MGVGTNQSTSIGSFQSLSSSCSAILMMEKKKKREKKGVVDDNHVLVDFVLHMEVSVE